MGCTKTLSTFLRNVGVPTGATSEYIYNGYAEEFDGDVDNLAQFVDTPADPPVEFPTAGDPIAFDSFDPEGVTAGYYSLTFVIEAFGDCPETETNFVIPIVEQFDAGISETKAYLISNTTPVNLYTAWGDKAPTDPTGFGWLNSGQVNAYPGYSNGGTSLDITDDTFTPSVAGIGVYRFTFGGIPPAPTGFNNECRECFNARQLTIRITAACTGTVFCYEIVVPPANEIHSIELEDGTSLSAAEFPGEFTFPYDTDETGDADQLETDLNAWLVDNGGGTATVTFSGITGFTINIDSPCFGPTDVCLDALCATSEEPTITVCA